MLARIGLLFLVFFFSTQRFIWAGLITNGDFETGDLTGWNSPPFGSAIEGVNVLSPGGTQEEHYAELWAVAMPNYGPDGTISSWMYGNASLSQQITVNAGDTISFDYRTPGAWNNISMSSLLIESTFYELPAAPSVWSQYSKSFTLAGTYLITFGQGAPGGGGMGYLNVDNVRIVPVPEPSSLLLLALGLTGAFFSLKCRKCRALSFIAFFVFPAFTYAKEARIPLGRLGGREFC